MKTLASRGIEAIAEQIYHHSLGCLPAALVVYICVLLSVSRVLAQCDANICQPGVCPTGFTGSCCGGPIR